MPIESLVKPIYRIGRIKFTIKNCTTELGDLAAKILIAETLEEAEPVREIDTGCAQDIRELFDHLLRKHYKNVWIRGSCLISPAGRKILLVGQPGSGKTTLALALAVGHGWKVVCEDVVLLDIESCEVINCLIPFLVRSGSHEMLANSVGFSADSLVARKWHPLGTSAYQKDVKAQFDAVFILGRWTPRMKTQQLSASECLRLLVEMSNIIKRKGSADTIMPLLESAECTLLRGGTLAERIAFFSNQVSVNNYEYESQSKTKSHN